ncbi:hypothetical protein [Reichenbachiella versicolor]|uniref:hypothetical protein n=1 Tax=Reichenbachiella versicolor TaxID=1821036 RepID=UPI000D6DE169|nr:hypothetical protein [Reichenbachiella versicolor]
MSNFLFTVVLFLGSIVLAHAQPNFKIVDFEPKGDKKPSYYNSQAKKERKKNRIDNALLCASYALEIASKKKDISNAQEVLRTYYTAQVESNLRKIDEHKVATAEFKGDGTVTKQAEIYNMYVAMNKYNKVLRKLPASKFTPVKKKDAKVEIQIAEPYSSEVNRALVAFEKGKRKAAEMHYKEGLSHFNIGPDNKQANRRAARRFAYAQGYVQNYKDADGLYEQAVQRGTVSIGVMPIESGGDKCDAESVNEMTRLITSQLRKENIEFIEVRGYEKNAATDVTYALARGLVNSLNISDSKKSNTTASLNESKFDMSSGDLDQIRNADYVLTGKLGACRTSSITEDSGEKVFSREVVVGQETYKDEDGKEKKRDVKKEVTAKSKKKVKTVKASAAVKYRLVAKGGRVVWARELSDKESWTTEWYVFLSGDKRAMDDAKTKPSSTPKLIGDAARQLAQSMSKELKQFAKNEVKD